MGTASDHQLTIDVGNSGVKAAVFLNGTMIGSVVRFTNQEWEVADRLITNHRVKNIIFSTVANVLPHKWMDKWESAGRLVVALSPEMPLPFTSVYETMETLGLDRIAVVAGSMALSTNPAPAFAPPHQLTPKLIVDAGTCATLDLVDASGVYHGGNISPGIRMRLQAMHAFTARLPQPEPAETLSGVGRSTIGALRHGAQLGLVYEIEGLYQRLSADFFGLELLLTGGDGAWLEQHLSIPCRFYPNLVLLGLNQILSNYVQHES